MEVDLFSFGGRISAFSTVAKPAQALSLEAKHRGCEADHSSPFNAVVHIL